jgi:hypothetical protein
MMVVVCVVQVLENRDIGSTAYSVDTGGAADFLGGGAGSSHAKSRLRSQCVGPRFGLLRCVADPTLS